MKFYNVYIDETVGLPTREQVIKKYTDNYQGFVAEEYLGYLYGLINEEPKRLVIKVNGITEVKYIPEEDVTLKPSKLPIKKDNCAQLKMIELMGGIGKINYDHPDPIKAITKIITDEKINPLKVLSMAKKHFAAKEK